MTMHSAATEGKQALTQPISTWHFSVQPCLALLALLVFLGLGSYNIPPLVMAALVFAWVSPTFESSQLSVPVVGICDRYFGSTVLLQGTIG